MAAGLLTGHAYPALPARKDSEFYGAIAHVRSSTVKSADTSSIFRVQLMIYRNMPDDMAPGKLLEDLARSVARGVVA